MDPLQAESPEGGCPALTCRLRARERFDHDTRRIAARRRAEGAEALRQIGIDPDEAVWSPVPSNSAPETPLDPRLVADFQRHLDRLVGDDHPAPSPPGAADPLPLPEGRALSRACATCRGWCCRRGGTHAFLDAASLHRVRTEHPGWSREKLEESYLDHAGPTHLQGGCIFQGPAGCRLPVKLRSDTCNDWWCPDLIEVQRRWKESGDDPANTRFIAIR